MYPYNKLEKKKSKFKQQIKIIEIGDLQIACPLSMNKV